MAKKLDQNAVSQTILKDVPGSPVDKEWEINDRAVWITDNTAYQGKVVQVLSPTVATVQLIGDGYGVTDRRAIGIREGTPNLWNYGPCKE